MMARSFIAIDYIGSLIVVGVLLLVWKLTGFVNWSWWWVIAPYWGPFALLGATVLVVLLGIVVLAFVHSMRERARRNHEEREEGDS